MAPLWCILRRDRALRRSPHHQEAAGQMVDSGGHAGVFVLYPGLHATAVVLGGNGLHHVGRGWGPHGSGVEILSDTGITFI